VPDGTGNLTASLLGNLQEILTSSILVEFSFLEMAFRWRVIFWGLV
jgi:hypothetical protein